jgi:N-acetyltransferase 10
MALTILNPKKVEGVAEPGKYRFVESVTNFAEVLTKQQLDVYFNAYDLKRLDSYSHNLVDFHVIMDLMPALSQLYFMGKLPVNFSAGQSAIFAGVGLQHKTVEDVAVC